MVRLSAIVIFLLGLVLIAAGAYLAWLGGSWYYVICGLGFIAAGAALFGHRPAALLIYALVLAGTLIWAVYEVGFDWWQLAPRGGVIVLIGLWLVMPWITGRLHDADDPDDSERVSRRRSHPHGNVCWSRWRSRPMRC